MNIGRIHENMVKKQIETNPKISIEGSDMEVEIKTCGVSTDNKVDCTLNLYFSAEPNDVAQLLKLVGEINDMSRKTHTLTMEDNERVYLTDVWRLNLEFKEFEKEIIE